MFLLYLIFILIFKIHGYETIQENSENGPNSASLPNIFNKPGKIENLMKTLSFHSYSITSKNDSSNKKLIFKPSFIDSGSRLYRQLRQIANSELKVAKLQDIFNSLSYVSVDNEEEATLEKMVRSLEEKVELYSKLIIDMVDAVKINYQTYKKNKFEQTPPSFKRENILVDFIHRGQIIEEQPEYYPCCVIPDHYLIFNPHFGTKVNTELWCDSGVEPVNLQNENTFMPTKLTELFSVNYHMHPAIKWQFFMSSNGVHTEFPAHRPGTSIGSGCGESSRHHQIYEKTIRPDGRNIVLLFDLGHTLRPRILLTAKAIGHYVIDTLTTKDNIAIVGVSDSIFVPVPQCMGSYLVTANDDVKKSLRHFIDFMEFQDVPTNHSLGLDKALEIIENWPPSRSNRLNGDKMSPILLVYVTRGILGHSDETFHVLKTVAKRRNSIRADVIISAFALGISHNEPSIHRKFLEILVNQNFKKYKINVDKSVSIGEVIPVPNTLRVAAYIRNFYNITVEPSNKEKNVTISDIYWDSQGRNMVVTFSKAVHVEDENNGKELVGVVGLDLSLSYLVEEASYYSSPSGGYAFIMDKKGDILYHPKMGRRRLLNSPLIKTSATLLESFSSFWQVAPHMLKLPFGHKRNNQESKTNKEQREYWWRRSDSFGWIFVISGETERRSSFKLSPDLSPIPSDAIFHRLDLLLPQQARVCRHFNQMATLDGASLFLAPGTYISPHTYLAKSFRNLNVDMTMLAFLMDDSNLLVNAGLKEGVKAETSALYHLANLWKDKTSTLQKYIVRRYAATISGVTLIYPGTLMDASYDPTSQGWFIKAMERPGEIVVSPPLLDPGGAGYIVTVSHTVYQGITNLHHLSADPVLAVVAADFTLGYWHKILAGIEPMCANSIYFRELNNGEKVKRNDVRCFLMDTSGYLIAHSAFMDPSTISHSINLPRHITHEEPVLSMSLLGKAAPSYGKKNRPVMKKIWCGKQWKGVSERFYSIELEAGQLVASISRKNSDSGQLKSERSCLQYKLTAVPSSNLILGLINQTCLPPTAFCPCSTVERPCLNCQFMESAACECPCECSLPSEPCSLLPYSPLTSYDKPLTPHDKPINQHEELQISPKIVSASNFPSSETQKTLKGAPVSCPRTPEIPGPLHYGVGMLAELNPCLPPICEAHTTDHSCLGVLDCIWCVLESDGVTLLNTPHCTQAHKCYGGIRGGPSPYPPGLAPLPHSEERGSALPIVPVIGGVMIVFLILGIAIYIYRTYTAGRGRSARSTYASTSTQSQNHHSPLYPNDNDIENIDDNLLDESGILPMGLGAAAAISPYRMNPTYRRPPHTQGEASDPGYSTMTPHEESDHLTLNEDLSTGWSDTQNQTEMAVCGQSVGATSDFFDGRDGTDNTFLSRQSPPLSSPKKIGPNKLIVPVTVHMVDTV